MSEPIAMPTLSREKVLDLLIEWESRAREVPGYNAFAFIRFLLESIQAGELDTLSDPALCLKIGEELGQIEKWIQRHSVFIVASEIRKLKAEAERLKNKYEPTPPRVEY